MAIDSDNFIKRETRGRKLNVKLSDVTVDIFATKFHASFFCSAAKGDKPMQKRQKIRGYLFYQLRSKHKKALQLIGEMLLKNTNILPLL